MPELDAHISEAGVDLPLALAEQLEVAWMLEHGITKERLPFVYGWDRLSVSAPTRELCQRRVEALVELPGYRHRRGQLHWRPVRAAA
jgi:hypothetical protein